MMAMFAVNNKRGDMNWFLVTLLIALFFAFVIGFVYKAFLSKFTEPAGEFADKTASELDKASQDLFPDEKENDNIVGQAVTMITSAYDYVSGVDEKKGYADE